MPKLVAQVPMRAPANNTGQKGIAARVKGQRAMAEKRRPTGLDVDEARRSVGLCVKICRAAGGARIPNRAIASESEWMRCDRGGYGRLLGLDPVRW